MATRGLVSSIGVKLREVILKERNKEITPESITMWFKRHPDVKAELEKEIIEEQLPAKVVDESIFENGTFEELPSVKNWIEEMEDRHLSELYIGNQVRALKRLCRGHNLSEYEWSFKHPDRLTLDEVRDYIRKLRKKGKETHNVRIASRDFLLSKGIAAGKKISGAKESGKYAKLKLPPEIVRDFLEGVKSLNYQAYGVDLFIKKTGTRLSASLDILIEDISLDEINTIVVFDKGRRSIHPKGKRWEKYVDNELWKVLKNIIEERHIGKIFTITKKEARQINSAILRDMITKYASQPKIQRLLKMCVKIPTHWLRHQFFQRCLELTKWNYGACAALGGSTVKSLEESYGLPPDAVVKRWGLEYMPQI